MKTIKNIFMGIMIVFLTIIWLAWFGYKKATRPVVDEEKTTGSTKREIVATVTIPYTIMLTFSTGHPSEIIPVGPDQAVSYRWISGQELGLLIHYNGGKGANGGWDVKVPPFKDWQRLGYEPESFPNQSTSISFSIQHGYNGRAVVECTFTKK